MIYMSLRLPNRNLQDVLSNGQHIVADAYTAHVISVPSAAGPGAAAGFGATTGLGAAATGAGVGAAVGAAVGVPDRSNKN